MVIKFETTSLSILSKLVNFYQRVAKGGFVPTTLDTQSFIGAIPFSLYRGFYIYLLTPGAATPYLVL